MGLEEMSDSFFLGVDESNHGRFAEIFVGCYSNNPYNVVPGNFHKIRLRKNQNKGRDFFNTPYFHILFSKEDDKIIGRINFPVIAVSEFVRATQSFGKVDFVYIDGSLRKKQRESLLKILSPFPDIEIVCEPHLDKKLKLVNEADKLANYLFRYYSSKSEGKKRKYIHTLLTPRIEDYRDLLS